MGAKGSFEIVHVDYSEDEKNTFALGERITDAGVVGRKLRRETDKLARERLGLQAKPD